MSADLIHSARRSGARLAPRTAFRTLGPRFVAATLALALAAFSPSCDNVACVFGPGNCTGGPGGPFGENPATLPLNGQTIEAASPTTVDIFPNGTGADVKTPVAIVFNESIAETNLSTTPPTTIANSLLLRPPTGITLPLTQAALAAEGRVLLLFPPLALAPSTVYELVLREEAVLADLTGQSLVVPANRVLGSFTTAATPANAPKLLMSWPRSGTTDQPETGEIVVVFTRKVQPLTVDSDSIDVTVDNGPPPTDPAPRQILPTDPRAFSWHSVGGDGNSSPLGLGVEVAVELSPSGHVILDEEDNPLVHTTIEYTTATFASPLSAAITSEPHDAIGIDQISGPENLAIQIQLEGAEDGDKLALTMFGLTPVSGGPPELSALSRQVDLVAPFDSFTMTAEEVGLLANSSPVTARFLDGPVAFAFQLRSGTSISPLRLLDVDLDLAGVQSPILDMHAPTLVGLGTSGTSLTTVRSDVRDITIVGQASEVVRSAAVSTSLGDNAITPGVVPPVVGGHATGLFIAAPVRRGVLAASDQPVDFTLTIYDKALNATTVRSSNTDPDDGFRQLGASGPGNALPGGNINVEVFDAITLAPIASASVYTHQNVGGTVTAVPGGISLTDADGFAVVPAAAAGETILTVIDTSRTRIFTFDDVPTDQVGIPLQPVVDPLADAFGTVVPAGQNIAVAFNSDQVDPAVTDSRHLESGEPLAPLDACTTTLPPLECSFGPIAIQALEIGSETVLASRVLRNESEYIAQTFLKAMELSLPVPPVLTGSDGENAIAVPHLLDDLSLGIEDLPIDVPAHVLSTVNWAAPVVGPTITVEAVSPGIPGPVVVGRGIAFDAGANSFTVRAAYPGSADGIQDSPTDEPGSLVTDGTIGADLLLRADVADQGGNRGGSRPRFSNSTLLLEPPAAPVLAANPITPNPGGQSLDLRSPDVLPDSLASHGRGLHRAMLTDALGRSWTVFRQDRPDASGPDVVFHLPELAGVFPLVSGDVDCVLSAWAWETLDVSRFLWTDIDREHDAYVHSAVQTFLLP